MAAYTQAGSAASLKCVIFERFSYSEVRRIPIPRTSVNRGKRRSERADSTTVLHPVLPTCVVTKGAPRGEPLILLSAYALLDLTAATEAARADRLRRW